MRILLGSASLLLAACGVVTGAPDPAPRFEAGLGAEDRLFAGRLWDDGQAEIAYYDTRDPRYDVLRDGRAVLIAVKETLDADALVKADGPPPRHTVDAIKLGHLVDVETGVYAYRQMANAWIERASGRPLRVTVGSQDWCGQTFKVLTMGQDGALVRTFSYFGAEGERAFSVDVDDRTVLGDALPLWVRTLDLDRPGARRIRILDEQLANHARPPSIRDAVVRVGRTPREIETPAGRFDAIPVVVERGDRRETFWLDERPPHPIVRWERPDGGSYQLRRIARAAYWEMNGPEDLGALDPGPHSAGGM
jgi:hypothetical protein